VLRILGGSIRGRKLVGPRGTCFRPTTGRVREFIYSWLAEGVLDAELLDLFAGTGSLGLEALSRGAEQVVFVERSASSVALLRKNLELCGFTRFGSIIKNDVFEAIDRLEGQGASFDCILADPPFKSSLRSRILEGISKTNLLRPSGWLIVEHEQHDTDSGDHELELIKQRKFGHCVVSIYRAVNKGAS
jgi:16S rRNA (guanine(966)-N(2))-methyltransferase RsmD